MLLVIYLGDTEMSEERIITMFYGKITSIVEDSVFVILKDINGHTEHRRFEDEDKEKLLNIFESDDRYFPYFLFKTFVKDKRLGKAIFGVTDNTKEKV